MADYKRMYAVLCGAVDAVLDELQTIPLARPCVRRLDSALKMAEDIYLDTEPYPLREQGGEIIRLIYDVPPET